MAGVIVRAGGPADLAAVARIQNACPGLARWDPADYLAFDFLVAASGCRVIGFIVARDVAPHESEVVNLAVEPSVRRCGVARQLMGEIQLRHKGYIFLEVRESNYGAREFYQVCGFEQVSKRPGYYQNPLEAAIVLKFHSC
jgi:ribosomal-protein-alanine N-acetyltransferase